MAISQMRESRHTKEGPLAQGLGEDQENPDLWEAQTHNRLGNREQKETAGVETVSALVCVSFEGAGVLSLS